MRALKDRLDGAIEFHGIGGEAMAAQGLESLFPISDMAVMGIFEILPKAPKMLRRVRETADTAWTLEPDVVISIDSKAFTLRVQKRLFRRRSDSPGWNAKLIHWVPPTVWAWRPGRAKVIAQFLDHLLCLFPFEPPYFEAHGLSTDFVGHPAASVPRGDGDAFRNRFQIPVQSRVLGVLPGSRPGEVRRLLPVFGEAVRRLADRYTDLHVVIPTVSLVEQAVRDGTKEWLCPGSHRHGRSVQTGCSPPVIWPWPHLGP